MKSMIKSKWSATKIGGITVINLTEYQTLVSIFLI